MSNEMDALSDSLDSVDVSNQNQLTHDDLDIDDKNQLTDDDLDLDQKVPEPAKPIIPELPKFQPIIPEPHDKKIVINVGGKKFSLKKQLLDYFNVNHCRLKKITDTNRKIYFLDRDPVYFSRIIDLSKLYGFNKEKFVTDMTGYSEQLIHELCLYGLLDRKYEPKSRLKLKITGFKSINDDIIKVIVTGPDDRQHLFETFTGTLARSSKFYHKLVMTRSKSLNVSDVDPDVFRYILNLLRNGSLPIIYPEIIEQLDIYNVKYKIMEYNNNTDIVSYHTQHTTDAVRHQLNSYAIYLDPRNHPQHAANKFYQFKDNKYYNPLHCLLVSPNAENINNITTTSPLNFDSDIVFNLTEKDLGDCLQDLLVTIDLPTLNIRNKSLSASDIEYVDYIGYHLIDYVTITSNKKVLLQTTGDALYLYPVIYSDQPEKYHEMSKISVRNMQVLYDNNLINVHRITIPLFLFKDKQNHLPVKKMMTRGVTCQVVVHISPLTRIFKGKSIEIPLLNVNLIGNFINLAPTMNVMRENYEVHPTPVNTELRGDPIMYLYDKLYSVTAPIQITTNPIYNIAVIPLSTRSNGGEKVGLIKDFFFIIIENNGSTKIDNFSHELIEIEIMRIKDPKNVELLMKLDTFMLNQYIPLTKLGHVLPDGVYYHSFSADPKQCKMMGGLLGVSFYINIKIKKINGFVKFYFNEYSTEVI